MFVKIIGCTIEKPFSRWYENKIGETFKVVYEERNYIMVFDTLDNKNKRVSRIDTELVPL